jgi:hypothetical protein
MRHNYPLFQSHLDVAHSQWKALVCPGDIIIDATCGNGHDSLFLSQLALTPSSGQLFAIDIQNNAIAKTRELLQKVLSVDILERIRFIEGCHSAFPAEIFPQTVKLIAYNLGYLPGGDKTLTTGVETTLQSITKALELLVTAGVISITCYPGHEEGRKEEDVLLAYFAKLDPRVWQCTHQRWLNRRESPSHLLIQKGKNPVFI